MCKHRHNHIHAFSDWNGKQPIDSLTYIHSFLPVFHHLRYLNNSCRMKLYSCEKFKEICSFALYEGEVLAYTLSPVTFRMSTTSHCPEVMGVALPCRDKPAQTLCVCVCWSGRYTLLSQWIDPPWPRDGGVCTHWSHSSQGSSSPHLCQRLVLLERTADHRFICAKFKKEIKLCETVLSLQFLVNGSTS